jgi:hypothetical protein
MLLRSILNFVIPTLLLSIPITTVADQAKAPKVATQAGATTETATPTTPEMKAGTAAAAFAGQLADQSRQLDQGLTKAFDAMEAKLREKASLDEWKAQSKALTDALRSELDSSDDALLKSTSFTTEIEGTLSRELRESRGAIVDKVAADLKAGEAALANLKADNTPEQVLAVVKDALIQVRKVSSKDFDDKLKERNDKLLQLSAGNTVEAHPGQTPAEAKANAAAAAAADTAEFLKQFDATSGLSKVVRCAWSLTEATLLCLPQGLLISASEISEILVQDLPPGKRVKVRTFTVGDSSSLDLGTTRETWNRRLAQFEQSCATGPAKNRLTCDQMVFDTSMSRTAVIAVHKTRRFMPTYGGRRSSYDNAFHYLREYPDREKLSLVVSGQDPGILVDVQIVGEPATAETVRSATIPLAYRRWTYETGAFFAFTNLSDDELVTESVPVTTGMPAQVKVIKKVHSDTYTQETGIFLSVFNRNYPKVGFGLGFHTSSGRAPSVYLGPTFRLRSLGDHGLITASGGAAVLPVRRFPGLSSDPMKTYAPDSSVIAGKVVFKTGYYLMINLGFSFGPIDNGDSKGK